MRFGGKNIVSCQGGRIRRGHPKEECNPAYRHMREKYRMKKQMSEGR
jgi:hypothetical protein